MIERQTRTQSLKEARGSAETAFFLNVPFYWPPVVINGALDALGLDPSQSVATSSPSPPSRVKASWAVINVINVINDINLPNLLNLQICGDEGAVVRGGYTDAHVPRRGTKRQGRPQQNVEDFQPGAHPCGDRRV